MLTPRPLAPASHSSSRPPVPKGLACPACGSRRLAVAYTRPGAGGTVRRSRRCEKCGERFKTDEALRSEPT